MENIQNDINEIEDNFIIVSKNKNDIFNELDFKDDDERYLCESIINNLEKSIADGIKNLKTVQIPYIGCVRINPVKRKFREAKLHLSAVRKNITKEQYKEHVRSFVIDLQETQKKEDKIKINIIKLKRNNKKKYYELYKTLGKAYAEMFIKAIYLLDYIPFEQEWQDKYDELSGIDRDKLLKESLYYNEAEYNIISNQPRYKFK